MSQEDAGWNLPPRETWKLGEKREETAEAVCQKGQEDGVNNCMRKQPGKETHSWRRSCSKQENLVLEPGNRDHFIEVLQK